MTSLCTPISTPFSSASTELLTEQLRLLRYAASAVESEDLAEEFEEAADRLFEEIAMRLEF